LLTVAELESVRDHSVPLRLATLKRQEVLLSNWSARNEENARRARRALLGVQNSRKAFDGRLAGLLDPALFSSKNKQESEFKSALKGKPEFEDALAAYDKIAAATKVLAAQARRAGLLEGGQGFDCDCFQLARALLRAAEERPKPNGERLREFSESGKASLELGLFSEKPIYPDLEILRLTDSLTVLSTQLGVDDPLVQKILAGKPPRDRAVELINGTSVREVAFRRKLYDGGTSLVSNANDPMIELARVIDPESRALRKVAEEQDEIKQQAHAAISRARNALLGTAGYPDATFTLRLSFGTVEGYQSEGKTVPPFTTFADLYERDRAMKDKPPFDLPSSWIKRRSRLKLTTPFNFVNSCDIIGGNSGSPVVNRNGDFVGIIFDGNLESLPWDYGYNSRQGRAIAVDSASIIAALDDVYGTKSLLKEIMSDSHVK
jgi:hypothetical protein